MVLTNYLKLFCSRVLGCRVFILYSWSPIDFPTFDWLIDVIDQLLEGHVYRLYQAISHTKEDHVFVILEVTISFLILLINGQPNYTTESLLTPAIDVLICLSITDDHPHSSQLQDIQHISAIKCYFYAFWMYFQ